MTFDLTRNFRMDEKRTASSSSSLSKSLRTSLKASEQSSSGLPSSSSNREMMALSDQDQIVGPSSSSGAKLKCSVQDVYPRPEIAIYRLSEQNGQRMQLLDVERKEELSSNGKAHNIEITAQVIDAELTRKYGHDNSDATHYTFECLMNMDINGANITKSSLIQYFRVTSRGSPSETQTTALFSYITLLIGLFMCYRYPGR